uniref:F-box domain-containing protein n=1 Tax=Panagrellus redivivus TaxID=6233 RepID=A0A7E4W9N1_PANRE
MSFRLSTLPYGLNRRLHELAKPFELLQLQEASQSCAIGFCPRPFRRRFSRGAAVTIELKDGAVQTRYGRADDADYVVCEHVLQLYGLTAMHLASDAICWRKLVLRPPTVTIRGCELSPEFMAQLASVIEGPVRAVTIMDCIGAVDFEALFKTFPKVAELGIFGDFAKTWTTDILQHQKSPLETLWLDGDFWDDDKLFECEDFKKLVSAQPPDFLMSLCPSFDPADDIWEIVSQGACPDLLPRDPEVKKVYIKSVYAGRKDCFLYC